MKTNNGGPAFQQTYTYDSIDHIKPGEIGCPVKVTAFASGMTLRDYFAAKVCAAMVSTIRSDDDYNRAAALAKKMGFDGLSEWFSADAYKQADAMLRAREKANEGQ